MSRASCIVWDTRQSEGNRMSEHERKRQLEIVRSEKALVADRVSDDVKKSTEKLADRYATDLRDLAKR